MNLTPTPNQALYAQVFYIETGPQYFRRVMKNFRGAPEGVPRPKAHVVAETREEAIKAFIHQYKLQNPDEVGKVFPVSHGEDVLVASSTRPSPLPEGEVPRDQEDAFKIVRSASGRASYTAQSELELHRPIKPVE